MKTTCFGDSDSCDHPWQFSEVSEASRFSKGLTASLKSSRELNCAVLIFSTVLRHLILCIESRPDWYRISVILDGLSTSPSVFSLTFTPCLEVTW